MELFYFHRISDFPFGRTTKGISWNGSARAATAANGLSQTGE
jgi:hypothetical protein